MSALRHFFDDIEAKNASATPDAGQDVNAAAPAGARGTSPKLQLTQDDYAKISHDEPPGMVARAAVEKALKTFLQDLARAQKSKANIVKSTDKVWQADVALHDGLQDDTGGLFTPTGGDGHEYDADELAGKIAARLPDFIPVENFQKFQKLKATDTALPGSMAAQLHKKYEEARDAILAKLPEKVRGLAKKGMDAAVEKGISYVADAALKQVGLPKDVQDAMEKVVDDYAGKITGDDKKDK